MGPQAALEEAVARSIRANLGYVEFGGGPTCRRTADGQPPALGSKVFVAVWSRGSRSSESRTCFDERFGIQVTGSVQVQGLPRDRWLAMRDDLTERLDAIRALIHRDSLHWAVINAASVLAGRGDGVTAPVGFREALMFQGLENWRYEGAAWYSADASGGEPAAIVQTANFGKARLVQALGTGG